MPRAWLALDMMDTVIFDPYFPLLEQDDEMGSLARDGWKNADAWKLFELGHLSEEEYFEKFYIEGKLDGRPHPRKLKDKLEVGYRFMTGMESLLRSWKTAGGGLLLHTNYPVWFTSLRERFRLDDYFDLLVVSHQIGSRKPDPAFYRAIREAIGASTLCLFVDDREENVAGARDAGFEGILFPGAKELESILRARDLIP